MLYNRQEAAEILGISVSTLDKLRSERKIGYYQMHSRCHIQFSQAHLDRFQKSIEVQPCREYAGEEITDSNISNSSNGGFGKKKRAANRL